MEEQNLEFIQLKWPIWKMLQYWKAKRQGLEGPAWWKHLAESRDLEVSGDESCTMTR